MMLLSASLPAQTPYLVKDINTTLDVGSSYPSAFTKVGSQVFFLASFREGVQLWKTDGSSGGTMAVSSRYFSSISSLTSSNGKLFFITYDVGTSELWVSDGSADGTRMLKSMIGFGAPAIADVNGTIFFIGETETYSNALWKSDGTVAGTVLVKDLDTLFGSSPASLTAVNGYVYFVTGYDPVGWTLWRSDGTEANTVVVKSIPAGPANTSPSNFINLNGTLLFTAYDGTISPAGVGLWKSDGTDAGTVMLKSIIVADPKSYVAEFTKVNGTVFFRTVVEGIHDSDLWKTDGTVDGTSLVTSICSGTCVSRMSYLTNVNGTLFFSAYGSLWRSDGTMAGTVSVVNELSPTDLVEVNGQLFFSGSNATSGRELWKSDGTSAGTSMVTDICPGVCNSLVQGSGTGYTYLGSMPVGGLSGSFSRSIVVPASGIVSANGKAFFLARDGSHGAEPWVSDGSASGSLMLKNIVVNTASSITSAADLNGKLVFGAFSGTERGVWRSDGTEAGTASVKDISPIGDFHLFNGALFFMGGDDSRHLGIWKTDGTDAGTTLVGNFDSTVDPLVALLGPTLTLAGNKLFFVASDADHGRELWKTDGTSAGTAIVKDIASGADNSNPSNLTGVNGTLYFTALDASGSAALWKSDGTDAGTVMVRDFPPLVGINCSIPTSFLCTGMYAPQSLTASNGKLFFTAYGDTGEELWKSDGTLVGTEKVAPGAANPTLPQLVDVNSSLFFIGIGDPAGYGLWKTDGTVQGTVLVKSILPSSFGTSTQSMAANMTNVNGTLYFTSQSGSEAGLWKSDGTTTGTVEVKAVQASALTNIKGTLFFVGADSNGTELWKSDGTEQGTTMVADIMPGSDGSWPQILGASRGRLFFSATDVEHGTELWALTIAPTSVTLRSSKSTSVVNTVVTLTATVTSTAAGMLGGTVNFVDGAVALGSASLNGAGVATLTTANLSAGIHSIAALYAGDSNYAESTSPVIAQTILSASPDYTLTATPTSMTIRAGESASFTLTATADSNFDGTIAVTCGPLPKGATCNFSPSASLAPTNGHAASTTLVVSTTSQLASSKPASGSTIIWASVSGFGIVGFLLVGKSRKKGIIVAATVLFVMVALSLTSCGGGGTTSQGRTNPNGTPSGAATVQVTATATAGTNGGNTSAHSLVLNITIQ